ncbi:hypothetical protein BO99DRAFT_118803 [Aspergillus violaceofuscus CBS 115571]|uniref:Uncharacterized protein n=1 Tax=Aspergillus violaceofuscus (strain CBS 115571) TaxID=1450538 RepID=A0A2V5IK06_ASPV1|nr:hypothetical protein BO99DRAFT_118803 [Aspergillus violaceofuscus CBS 115571]
MIYLSLPLPPACGLNSSYLVGYYSLPSYPRLLITCSVCGCGSAAHFLWLRLLLLLLLLPLLLSDSCSFRTDCLSRDLPACALIVKLILDARSPNPSCLVSFRTKSKALGSV